jgi:hypothetical protein
MKPPRPITPDEAKAVWTAVKNQAVDVAATVLTGDAAAGLEAAT